MLVSNRFWLLAIVGEPFVAEVETRVPETLDLLTARFRATHERETTWLAGATDAALSRPLESALIPGGRCLVSEPCCRCVCTRRGTARSARRCCARSAARHPPPISFSGASIGGPLRGRATEPAQKRQITRAASPLESGYSSVSAYIAAFKQTFGYTPGALAGATTANGF